MTQPQQKQGHAQQNAVWLRQTDQYTPRAGCDVVAAAQVVEGRDVAEKKQRLGVSRREEERERIGGMGVFPLLKSLLPVVVAFLLPTTDTLDHRRVGNGTHRHGLFQEPMEELPAMA